MSSFIQRLSKDIFLNRRNLLHLAQTTGRTTAKYNSTLHGISKNNGLLSVSSLRLFSSSSDPPSEDSGSQNSNNYSEPFIPPYQPKDGESIQVLRARLLYQSRKRGMLENGLLLSTFAAQNLDLMTETELKDYDRLINLPSNDWDIYYWATGVRPIPPDFDTPIIHKFIQHVKNNKKETRFHQPDLPTSVSSSLSN